MTKAIKTTQQIIEQAFIKDRIFGISIEDKDRIHFYETDNKRKKKWVSLYNLKKEAREMSERFPEESEIILELIKKLKGDSR